MHVDDDGKYLYTEPSWMKNPWVIKPAGCVCVRVCVSPQPAPSTGKFESQVRCAVFLLTGSCAGFKENYFIANLRLQFWACLLGSKPSSGIGTSMETCTGLQGEKSAVLCRLQESSTVFGLSPKMLPPNIQSASFLTEEVQMETRSQQCTILSCGSESLN